MRRELLPPPTSPSTRVGWRRVTYRDESEALRAHVAKLEGELAAARAKIDSLEGRAAPRGDGPELVHSKWLGAPTAITLERVLPFAIDEEGYEAIADAVRSRLGVQVTQVGRSLHGAPLSITREGDHTRVRVAASWGVLKGGPIAGSALGGAFAGLTTIASMHDFSHASPAATVAGAAAAVVTVALGLDWLLRGRARSLANKNVERYRGLFETVLSIAEKHAIRRNDVQARVEVEVEDVEVPTDGAQPAARGSSGR